MALIQLLTAILIILVTNASQQHKNTNDPEAKEIANSRMRQLNNPLILDGSSMDDNKFDIENQFAEREGTGETIPMTEAQMSASRVNHPDTPTAEFNEFELTTGIERESSEKNNGQISVEQHAPSNPLNNDDGGCDSIIFCLFAGFASVIAIIILFVVYR